MTPAEAYERFGWAVVHIVASRDGVRLGSGTGFLSKGLVVTCAHVLDGLSPDCRIDFRFPHDKRCGASWSVPPGDLIRRGYSQQHSYDYTIVAAPPEIDLPKGLEFSEDEPVVGSPVCGLGYPFEHNDLTIAAGHISSTYDSGVARIFKLDMSVNPSNSGGPLISLDTGKVVGVIARKETGLSKSFDELREAIASNIKFAENIGEVMRVGNFGLMDSFTATQNQLDSLLEEVKRSAQVGIGFAIYVDPLRTERAFDC